jgi:hypothetical protein
MVLQPGQDLVLVGYIGTRGVQELLHERAEQIRTYFSTTYLEEELEKRKRRDQRFASFGPSKEGECRPAELIKDFRQRYGVSKIKSVGKGGILKALWDFLEEDSVDPETGKRTGAPIGCRFRYDRLSMAQFDLEICELLDLSPFRLYTENCWILAMDRGTQFVEDFYALQHDRDVRQEHEALERGERNGFDAGHNRLQEPVPASVFGRIQKDKKRVRIDGSENSFLTRDGKVELDRYLSGKERTK